MDNLREIEYYLDRAKKLREDTGTHYNCAQSVIIPYADECGISREKAYQLGSFFGRGMKMGGCCGAITGGLMVIGMLGGTDEQYRMFMDDMRKGHDNLVNCADLLRKNKELGGDQKTHCDNMVNEAVENIYMTMNLNSTSDIKTPDASGSSHE